MRIQRRFESLEARQCLAALAFADQAIELGQSLEDALVADINKDGRDDVVASLSPGIGVSLFQADTARFADQRMIVDRGRLLSLADVDSDGDIDIVGVDTSIFWLENDGQGREFTRHELTDAPLLARPAADLFRATDVDGDGSTDFVYLASSQQLVTVLHVTAPTTSISSIPLVSLYATLQLGDVNRDGDLDAIIESGFVNRYSLFWTGAKFEAGPSPLGLPVDMFVLLADLDHNQALDVVAYKNQQMARYEVLPDGSGFALRQAFTEFDNLRYGPTRVAMGDYNGDGLVDIYYRESIGAGDEGGAYSVLPQRPNGSFAPAELLFVRPSSDLDWQVGDIGGDNRDRLLFFSSRGGIATGGSETYDLAPNWDSVSWIDAQDLDQDGDLDIITSAPWLYVYGDNPPWGQTTLLWYENVDGRGNFGAPHELEFRMSGERGELAWHEVVDLDHDGWVDIVGSFGNHIYWYKNLGAGQGFAGFEQLAQGGGADDVTDLDQDGLLEFLWLNSRQVLSFEQASSNSATLKGRRSLWQFEEPMRDLRTADVNLDGLPDLLAVSMSTMTLNWYKNLGDGTFDSAISIGNNAGSYDLIDLNQDSALDLLISQTTGSAAPAFRWYTNDGQGGFSAGRFGPAIANWKATDVESGDLDHDGDTDLLMATDNGVYWFENLGAEFAAAIRLYTATSASTSVIHLADLNQDGGLDWISSLRHGTKGLRWHEQCGVGDVNSDGRFDSTDLIALFTINEYEDQLPGNSTFETGDFNGDGEFDSSDLVFAFQAGSYLKNEVRGFGKVG